MTASEKALLDEFEQYLINVDLIVREHVEDAGAKSLVENFVTYRSNRLRIKHTKINFDDWWILYDKKVGSKKKLSKKWDKLPLKIQQQAMEQTKRYVDSTPDKQYRKNPETYLNQEGWEHEVIIPETEQDLVGTHLSGWINEQNEKGNDKQLENL